MPELDLGMLARLLRLTGDGGRQVRREVTNRYAANLWGDIDSRVPGAPRHESEIRPVARSDFLLMADCLTGELAPYTNQQIANLMALAAFAHERGFEEACRRGWCSVSDAGAPAVEYPAWPIDLPKPVSVLQGQEVTNG